PDGIELRPHPAGPAAGSRDIVDTDDYRRVRHAAKCRSFAVRGAGVTRADLGASGAPDACTRPPAALCGDRRLPVSGAGAIAFGVSDARPSASTGDLFRRHVGAPTIHVSRAMSPRIQSSQRDGLAATTAAP